MVTQWERYVLRKPYLLYDIVYDEMDPPLFLTASMSQSKRVVKLS